MKPVFAARALWSFVRLVRDPNRLDEVFTFSDQLVGSHSDTLQEMVEHVRKTPQGERALREKPRLSLRLDALRSHPEGSLAQAFAEFLTVRGLKPESIPTLAAPDEQSYLRAHLYETHDLWHVVTGFETDVAGELGLQAFYAAQLPGKLPIALLTMGFINTLLYAWGDSARRLDAITRGYALGKRARSLFGTDWASLWSTPLAEVREQLGLGERVEAAPQQLALAS